MKRIALFLVALLVLALMPAVASAATDAEEAAAIAVFTEALDDLETCIADECAEDLIAVEAALAVMKEVFPCLNFVGIDKAVEDLAAAILLDDLELIDLAVAAVLVEGLELIDAAIDSDCDVATTTTLAPTTTIAATTTVAGATTTIAEVVTDIPDGRSGPNAALLGMAALLVLLSGAALRASVRKG